MLIKIINTLNTTYLYPSLNPINLLFITKQKSHNPTNLSLHKLRAILHKKHKKIT